MRSVTKSAYYLRVWWRYRTLVETLVAAANDVDVVFEQHVGVAPVKAIVLTYKCRASLGSMPLNFQIDLSEEIDGVGLGVLVFRVARRFSLGKYQLEMEIVFVVVIRLSGSIESEQLLMVHPRRRDGSGLRRTPAPVGLHHPHSPTPTPAVPRRRLPLPATDPCPWAVSTPSTLDWKLDPFGTSGTSGIRGLGSPQP